MRGVAGIGALRTKSRSCMSSPQISYLPLYNTMEKHGPYSLKMNSANIKVI